MPGGKLRGVLLFTIKADLTSGVDLIADAERMGRMKIIPTRVPQGGDECREDGENDR